MIWASEQRGGVGERVVMHDDASTPPTSPLRKGGHRGFRPSVFARRVLLGLLVVSAILSGCERVAKVHRQPGIPVDGDSVKAIVALLEEMPGWKSLSGKPECHVERSKIEATVRQVAAYDLDEIRAAIECYDRESWEANNGVISSAAQGKLYLLTNYLFDLPETVRRDSPHFRVFGGGWIGLPISGDQFNPKESDLMSIRWPWSVDANGNWKLTGEFGGFLGPPFQPLTAFDYWRKAFGKRRTEQGKPGTDTYFETAGNTEIGNCPRFPPRM